jgi:hypothetical protein
VVLVAFACHEKRELVMVALTTLTITIAFWSAHARLGPLTNLKALALALAGGVWETIVQALFLLPVLFVVPLYSCYTDRAKATEVITGLLDAKSVITERARESGTVLNSGEGVVIKLAGRLKFGIVLSDGTIVGAGEDPPVVFILQPKVSGREVTWLCRGFPLKIVPTQCRHDQKSN